MREDEFWGDPAAFRPERFLNESRTRVEASKKDMVVTFGMGKKKLLALFVLIIFFQYFVISIKITSAAMQTSV